jgi:hypothetical protein
MSIDFEALTKCGLDVLAALETYPLGALLLIGVLLAAAALGFVWK